MVSYQAEPAPENDAERVPAWMDDFELEDDSVIFTDKPKRDDAPYPKRKPAAQSGPRLRYQLIVIGLLFVMLLGGISMFVMVSSGSSVMTSSSSVMSVGQQIQSMGLEFEYPESWPPLEQVNPYLDTSANGTQTVAVGRGTPEDLVAAGVFSTTDPGAMLTAWNAGEAFSLIGAQGAVHSYPNGLALAVTETMINGYPVWYGANDGGFQIYIFQVGHEWVFVYGTSATMQGPGFFPQGNIIGQVVSTLKIQ